MTIREAVVQLSPWTNHRSDCARVTEAGDCSCGLQEALKLVLAEPPIDVTVFGNMPYRWRQDLDAVGTVGCKATTEVRR